MIDFYKNLKKGWSKDEALRQAKLDYLQNTTKEYSAPSYWAHLVVAGDTTAIETRSGWGNRGLLGIVALGLLIIGFFFFRKNN